MEADDSGLVEGGTAAAAGGAEHPHKHHHHHHKQHGEHVAGADIHVEKIPSGCIP